MDMYEFPKTRKLSFFFFFTNRAERRLELQLTSIYISTISTISRSGVRAVEVMLQRFSVTVLHKKHKFKKKKVTEYTKRILHYNEFKSIHT